MVADGALAVMDRVLVGRGEALCAAEVTSRTVFRDTPWLLAALLRDD